MATPPAVELGDATAVEAEGGEGGADRGKRFG